MNTFFEHLIIRMSLYGFSHIDTKNGDFGNSSSIFSSPKRSFNVYIITERRDVNIYFSHVKSLSEIFDAPLLFSYLHICNSDTLPFSDQLNHFINNIALIDRAFNDPDLNKQLYKKGEDRFNRRRKNESGNLSV